MFNLNSLSKKIGVGFGCIIVILAVAVISTLLQVNSLQKTVQRFQTLRVPTAETGLTLKAGLYELQASTYAYLLTESSTYRDAIEVTWEDIITQSLLKFEDLNPRWTNVDNRTRFQQLKPRFDQLRYQLLRVQELASTDLTEAQNFYLERVIPLTAEIEIILERMVENQDALKDTELAGITASVYFLTLLQWILLASGLILGSVLAITINRAISKPIGEAVNVADAIARGDYSANLNIANSREMVTLAQALRDMRDALQERSQENERRSWLATGQAQLDQIMRGNSSLDLLTSDALSVLATYVGANVGALYLTEGTEQILLLKGRFAFKQTQTTERFKWGEGVIGQVASTKSPTTLTELDAKQVRVSSCLIDTPPTAVHIAPLCFEDEVIGVIELGKLTGFSDMDLQLIKTATEAIGIAIHSSLTQEKIKNLLEETQQQSEELQQQQEELEQTNEELEEHSQNLKEQQEELQAANEELEEQTQLITEKNQSLEAARESIELKARQLEVSSKYKSEFLANMSHELRTPLNSLLILANELASNGDKNLSSEQVESAQIISKSGHDLLTLINDILDLSKVEAGKLDVNVSDVDLDSYTKELTQIFRPQAQAKGLLFDVVIDETAPAQIKTDRQRLGQIVNNLIANALKFTERGEITIAFKLDIRGHLAIEVKDTGIGIAKDKINAIFEAFVQAEGGTSRKYGGTGLGLSISRELAKLLGGSLTAQSELGTGSTFTLFLPPSIQSSRGSPAPQTFRTAIEKSSPVPDGNYLNYPSIPDQRQEITEHDRTILIVEDDDEFAKLLTLQAKNKGFKHLNAATGEDGLKLAAQFKPDAIILDVNLPGMDGHVVLKELKNNTELRHIPIHIISSSERSIEPIKAGAVDFITKPVTRDQLNEAFNRIEHFVERKVKNLLIIEDDDDLRGIIVKLIGNGDVKCFEASCAAEALKRLESNIIDCIVLDVGLPDMSGFDLIREIHRLKSSTPPIIVYTGRELSREENAELEQYAETIIVKGVKSEERLLDETALFLHRTVTKLPESKREIITKIYNSEEALTGKRILVVDDDMRNVFALSKALGARGMTVLKAENGLTALSTLDIETDIDMVLMDIMMPEMDGYECMREIRKRTNFKNLPVIALTAKAMKDDRQKCIDAGANDYIPKPIDVDRLISLMRIWIKR